MISYRGKIRAARSAFVAFAALAAFCAPIGAADLQGRVIDRGTLKPNGAAKGIAGVQVTLYDGTRKIGSATTNSRGVYRIRKVPVPDFKAVYLARGWTPEQITRLYHLSAADTAARDVYVDAAPHEKPAARSGKAGKAAKADRSEGYYPGLARGFLALARQESFFRENAEDSLVDLSAFFDGRDAAAGYQGAMCELFWAEFLSQERPLETRYYLASALFPLLDSLGWGRLTGMKRYLDVTPDAVREVADGMRAGIRNPKKLPGPKDVRKAKAPLELASQIASELLSDPDLSEKAKDRFLAQWKKSWGKETPSFREDGDEASFKPNALMAKIAAARKADPEAQYLKGRGLFAARDYQGAIDAFDDANRLAGGHSAARHMEAVALMRLGRDQEALGRFQALREAPDPYWKAKGFYGLGVLAEKEQRHSEAANALWKAVRLHPEPEQIDLLAEVSLKLTDRGEIEKLLQERAATGDHRAHYWLGRYGEADQQSGVALDHYKKAWEAAPAPEYAEALARLNIAQEEYGPALALLEPMRAHLTPGGRLELAECLLQAGRNLDASREFQAAYARTPTADVLARYVEALVQANRAPEALAVVNAFPDQTHPKARFALAKAQVGMHQPDKARPALEELIKQEENNADYHHFLGVCWFEERNWSKAKREFDEALKYRQDHLEALYYTGLSGIKLGRAEAARNYFNELAQRTSPEWKAKGLMGVGLTFAAQGKPEAAENFYTRSLLVVETAEAQALLALSKRRLGAPEKWVPLAQKAFAMDNREPKAVVAMGEALIAQGKKREALKHYREALIDNPNSCELLAGQAKAQNLAGDYAAGRRSGDKAISLCPQEPDGYLYAGVASDKSGNRDEAKDLFKAYKKAGGDVALLPEDYR
jgi:tetratricopeptide (TPR) repeat protein